MSRVYIIILLITCRVWNVSMVLAPSIIVCNLVLSEMLKRMYDIVYCDYLLNSCLPPFTFKIHQLTQSSFGIWSSVLTELMKRYYGNSQMVTQTHLGQQLSQLSQRKSPASLPLQPITMTCSLCLMVHILL